MLSEFYKHNHMGDKHLNKCKICTCADVGARRVRLIANDPVWVEKEAERQRQKEKKRYFEKRKGTKKLQKERQKSGPKYDKKFPEKRYAGGVAARLIDCPEGSHRRHWSW